MAYNKFVVSDKLKTTYDQLEYMDMVAEQTKRERKNNTRKKEELEDKRFRMIAKVMFISGTVAALGLTTMAFAIHGQYSNWVERKHKSVGELSKI